MSNHGGSRKGAGRKKGFAALQAETARKIMAKMVMAEIKPITQALIVKAKAGDVAATRELFDRAFGKPLMTIEKELYQHVDNNT